MCDGGVSQLSVNIQIGLVKEKLFLDPGNLSLIGLKRLICSYIDEKFPRHEIFRLVDRLLIFRHEYASTNILQMVNSGSDIYDGCTLEVVVSIQPAAEENVEIRPHSLSIHSYKTPTFCDFCGEMLFGMFKQGLKCELCHYNYHKRCVFKIPNDCRKRPDSTTLSDSLSISSAGSTNNIGSPLIHPGNASPITPKKSGNIHGRPPWVDVHLANRLKIPHTFVIHTYTKPTKCHFCNKILVGVFKQGLQCKDCGYNVHKKCSERVPRDCTGEVPIGSEGEGLGSQEFDDRTEEESDEESRIMLSPDSPDTVITLDNFDSHMDHMAAQPSASNIPVQRLVQSVRQTKRVKSILKEGWMTHFTNKDSSKKKYYWRLDNKCITLFKADTGPNYHKEIPLSEILAVDSAKKMTGAESVPHRFEIRTANVDFFVGDGSTSDTDSDSEYFQSWESAIRQALEPSMTTISGTENSAASSADPGSGSRDAQAQKEGRETEISQSYQLFPDEVLGSGQFGIVYGGVHRVSGRNVAIKIIDKMRFPTKQETALKNEVSILQNLQHPGVVNLEKMFETPERIFVVMEKLRGDMLEMILSSEQSRLSERITKFLVTQILVALKHLHSKNIVHCDLKPENVLLSSDSEFPQVKLCDFGFARIIGEKGFRKSIVGTPAYLAPEVLRNKGYNRSLDMWSTGVIIYVSLSGTFPFNEDEDINEQIQNASFMYPPHPWKEISSQAIDLINNLLQVKQRKRYSVEKALIHSWLQDYQCWSDLRKLETRLNIRWLTHQADDNRWESYERQRQLYDVTERVAGVSM